MFDILGVGDAIVDKIISFNENDPVMQKILPVKGLFFVASIEEHNYLRNQETVAYYAGGSAANSIRNMSLLGMNAAFIGKAGQDEDGHFFDESLKKYGVHSFLIRTSEDKTGCSVVMVHKDKDRTQCALPCASNLLTKEEVKDEYLQNTRSILTEGYMINRRPELIEDVINRASFYGCKVFFTLSDVHCVKNKRELLLKVLPKIDILFGNEFEFEALNLDKNILDKTICVKTRGKDGVEILSHQDELFIEITPLNSIVNTNGAGDGFAGGFLASYLKNEPVDKNVSLGNFVAQGVLKTNLSYLPLDFEISY